VDVFAVMDEAMGCDVREAEREVLMNKLLTFLNILKYTMPPDEDEREQVRVYKASARRKQRQVGPAHQQLQTENNDL